MRRKDRERSADYAWKVVDESSWAVLSMTDPEGKAYAVPICIVRKGESIYFHSALEGMKIDCMKGCPDVCVVCVADTACPPDEFTMTYRSAVARGRVQEVESPEEARHALEILSRRYMPDSKLDIQEEVKKCSRATAVWKIAVDEITGKENPAKR